MLKLQLLNSELTILELINALKLTGKERVTFTDKKFRVISSINSAGSSLEVIKHNDKLEVTFDVARDELSIVGTVYTEFLNYLKLRSIEHDENIIIIKANNISLMSIV